jgi:hypothetical protein
MLCYWLRWDLAHFLPRLTLNHNLHPLSSLVQVWATLPCWNWLFFFVVLFLFLLWGQSGEKCSDCSHSLVMAVLPAISAIFVLGNLLKASWEFLGGGSVDHPLKSITLYHFYSNPPTTNWNALQEVQVQNSWRKTALHPTSRPPHITSLIVKRWP